MEWRGRVATARPGLAPHQQRDRGAGGQLAHPQVRRRYGKSDVVAAIAAGRAVRSGEATGTRKTHDGPVEALRALKSLTPAIHTAVMLITLLA